MLPRKFRLSSEEEFLRVYRWGYTVRSPSFRIRILSSPHTRIGVAVSGRTLRSAVKRNRVKRRVRALLREILPQIPPGRSIVISPAPMVLDRTFAELRQELIHSLKTIARPRRFPPPRAL